MVEIFKTKGKEKTGAQENGPFEMQKEVRRSMLGGQDRLIAAIIIASVEKREEKQSKGKGDSVDGAVAGKAKNTGERRKNMAAGPEKLFDSLGQPTEAFYARVRNTETHMC